MTVTSNFFCSYWGQGWNNDHALAWVVVPTLLVVTRLEQRVEALSWLIVPTLLPSDQGWNNSHGLRPRFLFLLTDKVGRYSHDCYYKRCPYCKNRKSLESNSHDCYLQRFLLLLVTRLEVTVMTVISNRCHSCNNWRRGWRQQSWFTSSLFQPCPL